MAYASSTKYLFVRLQKTFSSFEPSQYNDNVRQVELFHTKWFKFG